MSKIQKHKPELLQSIVLLIDNAKKQVALTVNSELSLLYWNIGSQINNNILQNKRAGYGKQIILEISKELTKKYGKGFSKRNLHNFVIFNELYPNKQIVQTLSAQLSWTHIRTFITIKNKLKNLFINFVMKIY